MPASKSLTPIPLGSDHPAHNLNIGDAEDIQTLLKLAPVKLPNRATVESLIQNYPKDKRWTSFREDFRYIYVMNWMYQCRGYIKLASEHFDADLFEIELFELVHPPPVDDLALLVNKTKLALLSKVHGKKVTSLASFEPLFRIYFGTGTPLGGSDDEEDSTEVDQSAYPRYDDLYIDEKIEILYLLMTEVSQYPDFRDFIDKNKFTPDQLRTPLIYSHSVKKNGHGEDYILAFDNTALYKRLVVAPELNVPKKRKLAPQWPEEEYGAEKFDSESIEFELIFNDIYGLDTFIKSLLHNKKNKKNKMILDVVQLRPFVANVLSYDIRKRKILSHRRKDFEMARLLATRKRSSRLEAKEKQRHLEEQERKIKEMEELQYAANRRRSQRARHQMQSKMKMDYTAGLSREERLNLRMQKVEDSATTSIAATPALSDAENAETNTILVLEDDVKTDPIAGAEVPVLDAPQVNAIIHSQPPQPSSADSISERFITTPVAVSGHSEAFPPYSGAPQAPSTEINEFPDTTRIAYSEPQLQISHPVISSGIEPIPVPAFSPIVVQSTAPDTITDQATIWAPKSDEIEKTSDVNFPQNND